MMTLADLFREVNRIVPDGFYRVGIGAWNYRRADQPADITWSIWVASLGISFEGPTPEAALAALRAAVAPPEPTPLDAVAVGDLGGAT